LKTVLIISLFVTGIESLILAYRLLIRKEYRSPLYLTLGTIALFCVPWTIGYGIMYSTMDKDIAFIAYRIGSLGWTVGLSIWFIFFYELDNYIAGRKRNIYVYLTVWAIGVFYWLLVLNGSFYVIDLKYSAWWGWEGVIIKDSVWVISYCVIILIGLIISINQIVHAVHLVKSKKQARLLKFIGMAFFLISIPAIIINIIIPFFAANIIPPLGNLLLSVIALIVGRIVMFYRVLDISPTMAASQIMFEVSDYVFLIDLDGNIKKTSNAAQAIINNNLHTQYNRKIWDIAQKLKDKDLFEKSAQSGAAFKTEITANDGKAIPVRCKITSVKDTHDDPIGYLLVMTDLRDMIAKEDLENAIENRTSEIAEKNRKLSEEIAERKKIERVLISIEEKQRAMISNISDVIAIIDENGILKFNSPNIEMQFGWNPEDIIGKDALSIIHTDDLENAKRFLADSLISNNSTETLQLKLLCKNGDYKIVNLTAVNKMQDPHIGGILLTYFDVTESARAEKERQMRAGRIHKQQETLLNITNDESIKQGHKEDSFRVITETSADSLSAERVSIWFLSDDMKELCCADSFNKLLNSHTIDSAIELKKYSKYEKSIRDGLTIAIDNTAYSNEAVEFKETSLISPDITSLLEAGIRMSGKVIGVLSIAHTGTPRIWEDDEKIFVTQMADMVTKAILYGERKVMVDKLRLFAYTIRSVSENISITDMNDKLIFINDSFCKTYGYKESEILGNTVEILRSKRNVPSNVNKILPKTKDGGWEGEIWNKKKDGTEFLIHLSTSIIKDEQDQPVALVGLATDITERKKEEERLFSLLRFQSEMLDTAAMWINTIDRNGNITFWNKAAEKISGYSKEEVLGNSKIWDWLYPDPDSKCKVYGATEYAISNNQRIENLQAEIRRKDGEIRNITWFTNNLIDEEGKSVGCITIGVDNTEQKRAENALRLSEQKMRLHIEQTPLGVIEWDRNYNVVSWNHSAELIFGYTAAEAIGKHTSYFISDRAREETVESLQDLLVKKGALRGCNENVTKNGKIILCEWYNTALTAADGEVIGVTSLVMDITARQIAEEEQSRLLEELKISRTQIEDEAIKLAGLNEQLTESGQKLKELNASKDKLFSIIAHDLKSPFLSLLGFSEILSNEFDHLTEDEMKESISGIYELSSNSYKLLENLLQWSRIQIGKIDFYPEPFNLHYELSPAILLLSQTAKIKNIKIENLIDRKAFITADKNMLNTIVRNLISNSIKFCNKGGKIIISSNEMEDCTEISVEDNGVGMDKIHLENLFSIDKNSSTKGTADETGTGLGLLLCKEMVEKHGGKITVQSTPGKGSEFKFTIPK
jgi:PAS domain S-box-containing protein